MKSIIPLNLIKFGVNIGYNLSILILILSVFLIPAYFFRKVPRVISVPVKVTLKHGISTKLDKKHEFQHTSLEVTNGNLNVIVNSNYIQGIRLCFFVAFLFLVQLIFRNLLRIVESLEKGSPFVQSNWERLRQLGLIIVLMEVLRLSKLFMFFSIFTNEVGLENANFSINYNFSFSVAMFFGAIILLILAEVFKKGTDLEEEIDDVV